MKFYEKLIILRKKTLLSQEALAEKLNVTRQTISKWELGQSKPDMDKLIEMSKLFNVNIDVLTNDELSIDDIKQESNDKNTKQKNTGNRKIYCSECAEKINRIGTKNRMKELRNS